VSQIEKTTLYTNNAKQVPILYPHFSLNSTSSLSPLSLSKITLEIDFPFAIQGVITFI
jgi:hypothetical protein